MSGIVLIGVNRPSQSYGRGKDNRWPGGHNVVWGNVLMDNCHPDLCPKGWAGRPELVMPTDDESNAHNVSDYNVYYRSKGRVMPFWRGWGATAYGNLEKWQEKTGYDRHSIIAEPTFVDLAKRDFHPAEGSPALWFARPSQCMRFDLDGNERPRRTTYLTAGAYEGPKELLDAYMAGTRPVAVGKYKIVALPAKRRKAIPLAKTALDPLRRGLRDQARRPIGGGLMGIEYDGVPYALTEDAEVLMLTKDRPTAIMPVGKQVRILHLLLAAVDPSTRPLATCTIAREDGHKIVLSWRGSRNIGPSIGKWDGRLADLPGQPGRTTVAWQGEWKGAPVRLFHTAWGNQNEWYPVKQLEWRLDDAGAKVIVLAATAE